MNGYAYNGGYDGSGMEDDGQHSGGNMMMMGQGGQSLDDIVNQNAKAIRRQSMPHPFGPSSNNMGGDMRRMSMMEYGANSPSTHYGHFQYDPNVSMDQGGQHEQNQRRQQSQNDLTINTNFANSAQGYNGMMSSAAYSSPGHPHSGFDMAMTSPYVDHGMGMQIDYNADQNMASAHGDMSQMNLFNQPQFSQSVMSPNMHHPSPQHTPHGPMSASGMDSSYGGNSSHTSQNTHSRRQSNNLQIPEISSAAHSGGVSPISHQSPAGPQDHSQSNFKAQHQNTQQISQDDKPVMPPDESYEGAGPQPAVSMENYNPNNQGFDWQPEGGSWPSTLANQPHMQTSYKNVYSSTGFDMLEVLARVSTRPNPEINIGSVDLSCAFVVCDVEKDDFPIVYCSDNFERLTGYTKHMILGRNCRFLQSPDGNVTPGIRRKYVDDDSVLYLKNMVNTRREAQISLINYRRGGQPFMNLLTMIPITWDSEQVKYFVGFQVDLVEQPNSVTNKNPDGSYSINYQQGAAMPRYVLSAPDQSQKTDLGQTIPRDDVSAILSTIGNGESEYAKRMWDKVLLENTDDVIHVLSLKGLFQWVSPSAARVLEYEPSEIIGTALSSVCHPSDIVPVTRELKDTSTGASVNVVFRIRRKNSGYMWFEGHGSLHTEQGKGRKSIILVGRERPVYALSQADIANADGVGDNELWTKMSTSGMFLYVSSNVRQLLDRQPDELVGVSIQSLMRADSKADFGRILEHARTGKKAAVKHEMINRRGQVLSAHTTLYPGDATEGLKPTFIVAQTRLIKFSRGSQTGRPQAYARNERQSSESVQSVAQGQVAGKDTPNSSGSGAQYVSASGTATTYGGQQGLVLGHQDVSLASEDNLFEELKTTKSSSWQYEIRQLEKKNRLLAEEVQSLIAAKKKRKRRRGKDQQKDCANCHTRVTPEWRRGPSGQRDLCNSCGLRWAKLNGRVSPRTSSQQSAHSGGSDKSAKKSISPLAITTSASPVAIKTESPVLPQNSGSNRATPGTEPKESPKATKPAEGHAANMEGASGVPDKIDEGVEEPE